MSVHKDSDFDRFVLEEGQCLLDTKCRVIGKQFTCWVKEYSLCCRKGVIVEVKSCVLG